jgi:hypothetical protein
MLNPPPDELATQRGYAATVATAANRLVAVSGAVYDAVKELNPVRPACGPTQRLSAVNAACARLAPASGSLVSARRPAHAFQMQRRQRVHS